LEISAESACRATSVRFDADAIIHRVPEPLLAAEIPFSRLDAHVAEQKLDLLQLAASLVTHPVSYIQKLVTICKVTPSRAGIRPR